MTQASQGKLVILSGPAGSGKSTVVQQLLRVFPGKLELSVSATTRQPRPNEVDGVNYHFLSLEEFQQKRQAGEFIESFEVFGLGNWYGTLKNEVEDRVCRGISVLLEIDVEGAMKVIECYPEAITIFLDTGNLKELEKRLRGRNTETEEVIQKRLAVAKHELEIAKQYRYRVTNHTLDNAVQEICQIIQTGTGVTSS